MTDRNAKLRAIIYLIDNAERELWARVCTEWCDLKGYKIVSVVGDDEPGARWPDVVRLLANGTADVVVTPRLSDLPVGRLPRVEGVVEEGEREQHERERGDPGS